MTPCGIGVVDNAAYAIGSIPQFTYYASETNVALSPKVWAVLFRMLAVSSVARTMLANFSSSGGFKLNLTSAEQAQATIIDGGGIQRSRVFTSKTFTADSAVHLVIAQFSGTSLSIVADKGTLSAANFAGFTAAPASPLTIWTDSAGANECTGMEILGAILGSSVLTQGQCDSYADSVKAARALVALPGGTTTGMWNVRCAMSDFCGKQKWYDDAGSTDLALRSASSRASRPIVTRTASPTWGW